MRSIVAAIFAAFFIVLASMDVGYGETTAQCDALSVDDDDTLTVYAMESEVILDDDVPLGAPEMVVDENHDVEDVATSSNDALVEVDIEFVTELIAETGEVSMDDPIGETFVASKEETVIVSEPVAVTVPVEAVKETIVQEEIVEVSVNEPEQDIDYEALEIARYVMSWQLPSGGWTKNQKAIYQRYWNGTEPIAKYYASDEITPLGTIDNDATVDEIRYLAGVFQNSKDSEVKASIVKGLEFLLVMQYDSGAFPQVYPYQDHACSNYENMATFNDDATTNVLWLYQDILKGRKSFGSNLVDAGMKQRIQVAYDKAIDYILESQIIVNGQLTGWCAQHDPVTYEPVEGRAFEPVSISGQESVSVARFLESVKGTHPGAKESVDGFVEWLKLVANDNMRYDRYTKTNQYFDYSEGDYMWYRFYEIGTNKGLFADSDGTIYYDFLEVSEERRKNYGYAGDWGEYFIQ